MSSILISCLLLPTNFMRSKINILRNHGGCLFLLLSFSELFNVFNTEYKKKFLMNDGYLEQQGPIEGLLNGIDFLVNTHLDYGDIIKETMAKCRRLDILRFTDIIVDTLFLVSQVS